MKDNFSTQSDHYAKFRPSYPNDLFQFINDLPINKGSCWDCGTGNGQLAIELARAFEQVFATDLSENQIANAVEKDNIQYSVQSAEHTNFADQIFDVVTVAQAIHWFDFEKFYDEVRRVCKPGAYLVVTGYGMHRVDKKVDEVIDDFYKNVTGPYWDPERILIDEEYETIPFPFDQIDVPRLSVSYDWTLDHQMGYLSTWSGLKHYMKETEHNPMPELRSNLEKVWGLDSTKKVTFPILLRVGKIR